jgi:hypothetical protein
LPAKVQNLRLVGDSGVFQEATAPITVKNLQAYSPNGRVLLDAATNAVDTLAGSARHEFRFRNAGSLSVSGAGISVDGGEFSSAQLSIEVAAGNLTVSAPLSVSGSSGFSGGRGANIHLTASGAVTINDVVSANGGDGAEGNGGSAQITVSAGGGITVASSAIVSALGGAGGSSFSGAGGNASVLLQNTGAGNPITISGSLFASGGNGSSGGGTGNVTVQSDGGVNIASTALIQAGGGGSSFSFFAPGNVAVTAYGGNIVQDGQVNAFGGAGTGIRLSAVGSGGAIVQNNSNAILNASAAYGSTPEIRLEAVAGIGTPANPVRINNLADPNINLQNGAGGDIAVSFYGGLVNIDSMVDVLNNNPTGQYFIQAEQGGINLTAQFQPGLTPTPLLPGQSVELKALNGGTIDIGTGAGIVVPGAGTGNVKLTALGGGSINLAAGTVVAGNEPELTADHMDIQGQVLALSGIVRVMPATAGRNIELGTSGPVVGALALDNAELNNMTAWDGFTIPAPGAAGGGLVIGDNFGGSGALTFTGNVNSSAYLNVYGTSIAQSGGKITGGVSGHAGTGNVTLTQPTNEITSVGGSTNGGTFTVTSTNTMYMGDITTNGGNVNIQTTGGNLLFDSLMNAGTGTVQLTSTGTIVDTHVGLDIQASSATLTAPGGIGTLLDPIETQLSTLSVSATGGSGEIGIINTGNLLLSSMAFSGTTAALESSGTLTTGNSIGVTGNVALKGQTGLNIVHAINPGSTGIVTLESGAGTDVVFSGAGGVNTSSGSISVTAGRDIIYGGSSQVNSLSGNILFDAGNDVLFNTQRINTSSGTVQISADRDYVHNSTSSHNTSSGSITIQTGRNFQYGSTSQINTSGGNITVQSVGDAMFTSGGINSSSGIVLIQAGDSVSLSGGTQVVSSTGAVYLEALGGSGVGLTLNGASIFGDVVNLSGSNVSVGSTTASAPSSVTAGSAMSIVALGDLKITGGSGSGASALVSSSGALMVTATGDVALSGGSGANAWAKLSGNPDVMLAGIGGAVRLDAGSGTGSYAKIDAIAPTTIYLDLINAASGGYFVNGIEGVVYDPVTGTGFFAGGLPAVLGTNLVVTYGGVPLPPGSPILEAIEEALQAPTQTLIVATTESTSPPDAEKEKDIFEEDGKKDKKKEAPVCR